MVRRFMGNDGRGKKVACYVGCRHVAFKTKIIIIIIIISFTLWSKEEQLVALKLVESLPDKDKISPD